MARSESTKLADEDLLAKVARSFQLSLRLVPRGRRATLSLAYLIARGADAICDLPGPDASWRVRQLRILRARVEGDPPTPLAPAPSPWDELSVTLHESLPRFVEGLVRLPLEHQGPTRRVLLELIDGMQRELSRGTERPGNDREVLAHAYRAAGCVGRYWTELRLLEAPKTTRRERQRWTRSGIRLGMGLQIVNLVRDEHEDGDRGRHHFPQPLESREVCTPWLARARAFLGSGIDYAEGLPRRHWRDRLAVLLPTVLGSRTLSHLTDRFEEHLRGERIKVPRRELATLLRSLVWRLPWPRRATRLARSCLGQDLSIQDVRPL